MANLINYLNLDIFQIFLLILGLFILSIVCYYAYKKTVSVIERLILILLGIICLLTLLTPNNNMFLGYFMVLAPLYPLEMLNKDPIKLKKSFKTSYIFIILSIGYLLLSIFAWINNLNTSLLSIILITIGTTLSIALTLQLKQKYANNKINY